MKAQVKAGVLAAAYVTRALEGFKELSGDMHSDIHKITGWKTEVSAPWGMFHQTLQDGFRVTHENVITEGKQL